MYHPALDPYHCAFRMLVLLRDRPDRDYDREALRILDFYAVFPELIPTIRFPQHLMRQKATFKGLHNPYWFNGDPTLVFGRMQHLQERALDLLYARGVLNPEKYRQGRIQIDEANLPSLSLRPPKIPTPNVINFLTRDLAALPFLGPGGLKDRSGLLEYRYDAV